MGARGCADGPWYVPAWPAWRAPARIPSRRQRHTDSPGPLRTGPLRARRPVAPRTRRTEPLRDCRGASSKKAPSQPNGMYCDMTPSSTEAPLVGRRARDGRRGLATPATAGADGLVAWVRGQRARPRASASHRRDAPRCRASREGPTWGRVSASSGRGRRQPTGNRAAVAARCARNVHSSSFAMIASGDLIRMEGIIGIG